MKNLFQLIKVSWRVKSNIQHCLKKDPSSDEYRFAKQYETLLNELDDNKTTKEQIDKLIVEVQDLQSKFREKEELNNLFSAIIDFLNQVKTVRG